MAKTKAAKQRRKQKTAANARRQAKLKEQSMRRSGWAGLTPEARRARVETHQQIERLEKAGMLSRLSAAGLLRRR